MLTMQLPMATMLLPMVTMLMLRWKLNMSKIQVTRLNMRKIMMASTVFTTLDASGLLDTPAPTLLTGPHPHNEEKAFFPLSRLTLLVAAALCTSIRKLQNSLTENRPSTLKILCAISLMLLPECTPLSCSISNGKDAANSSST